MSSPREINSFAVLDLETTGLPSENFNKANITELSIHGFAAENVCNSDLPRYRRANHSLNLCFNPRMIITPMAEELTGLDNYMLEKESWFNGNAANLVINFLQHLRQPVCLVAHSGDKFDFPILKDAFKKLRMELPPDVLCLDSYKALPQLDKQIEAEKAALLKEEAEAALLKEDSEEEEDFKLNTTAFLNDDEPSAIASTDSTSPDHNSVENVSTENTTISSEEDDTQKAVDWQTINETTPRQGTKKNATSRKQLKANTPVSGAKLKRRFLNFTTPLKVGLTPSPPVGTYKLTNIYTRLYGEQPKVSHQAEADVIMLKDIMYKYGDAFVKWAEENATPFTAVRPLSG